MTDGGFGHFARDLDAVVKCSAFDVFHYDVADDVVFVRFLERILELDDVGLLLV